MSGTANEVVVLGGGLSKFARTRSDGTPVDSVPAVATAERIKVVPAP